APGTWRIDTQFTIQGAFTVGGWASMYAELQVWDKNLATLLSKKVLFNEVVGYHRTHNMSHTVVLPEDMFNWDEDEDGNPIVTGGPYVCVRVWQSRNGGTNALYGDQFSYLSVNRWDLTTELTNPPSGGTAPPPISG